MFFKEWTLGSASIGSCIISLLKTLHPHQTCALFLLVFWKVFFWISPTTKSKWNHFSLYYCSSIAKVNQVIFHVHWNKSYPWYLIQHYIPCCTNRKNNLKIWSRRHWVKTHNAVTRHSGDTTILLINHTPWFLSIEHLQNICCIISFQNDFSRHFSKVMILKRSGFLWGLSKWRWQDWKVRLCHSRWRLGPVPATQIIMGSWLVRNDKTVSFSSHDFSKFTLVTCISTTNRKFQNCEIQETHKSIHALH